MKLKKLFNIIGGIFILLLIAAAALSAIGYYRAASSAEAKLSISPDFSAETSVLGDVVDVQFNCFLPWGQQIGQITFDPPEGIVVCGEPAADNQSYTLLGANKVITVPLRSYRTGKFDLGKLTAAIDRPMYRKGSRKLFLSAAAPSCTVKPQEITDLEQLPLADKLQEPESYRKWLLAALITAAVLVTALLLIYIVRRRLARRAEKVLPLWVTACNDLAELRQTAAAGKQSLEWCVSRLTDVVRNYLSRQFQLAATRQTTEEFFHAMRHSKSPLNSSQIVYLEKFMHSADLVKFANVKADLDDFSSAVNQAEELIVQTGSPRTDSAAENTEAQR